MFPLGKDKSDLIWFRDEITKTVREAVREELSQAATTVVEGIRVLSAKEAAALLGVTPRHLRRMEKRGKIPRRRQLTERRVAYYEHELLGQDPPRGRRILNHTELAQKLGITAPTLAKVLDKLPPESDDGDGLRYENQVDEWLLKRPRA